MSIAGSCGTGLVHTGGARGHAPPCHLARTSQAADLHAVVWAGQRQPGTNSMLRPGPSSARGACRQRRLASLAATAACTLAALIRPTVPLGNVIDATSLEQ